MHNHGDESTEERGGTHEGIVLVGRHIAIEDYRPPVQLSANTNCVEEFKEPENGSKTIGME